MKFENDNFQTHFHNARSEALNQSTQIIYTFLGSQSTIFPPSSKFDF